jgi:hypothetical protein
MSGATRQGPAHQQRLTADIDAGQQALPAQPMAERLLADSQPLHPGRLLSVSVRPTPVD